MNERDWLEHENCPIAERVWIAIEPTDGGIASVCIGFKSPEGGRWMFDRGGYVSDGGYHVLGWYPLSKPTYERI